jgi:hypothetical protein
MPSLYDKLMEKTVKESQQASPPMAHTPQEEMTRKPENQPARLLANQQISKEENQQTTKPANQQGSKPANIQTSKEIKKQSSKLAHQQSTKEKKKYGTYLREDSILSIQLHAVQTHRKDHEVVQDIIDLYFEKRK